MGSNEPSFLRRRGCVTRSSEYAIWARPWPRPQMRPFAYGCASLPLSVHSWPSTVVATSPHLLEQPLHSDGAVLVAPGSAATARSACHEPSEMEPAAQASAAVAAEPLRNVLRDTVVSLIPFLPFLPFTRLVYRLSP